MATAIEGADSCAVYIPQEFLAEFSEIVSVGLKRGKISQKARTQLRAWWDVERELIEEAIEKVKKS